MKISSDFKELLREFNAGGVRYLVVGGHAVMQYTEPRYTKDLDLWVDPAVGNARKAHAALRRFGAPLNAVTAADFTNRGLVYQIGVAPIRVDILMDVPGLSFKSAWKNRVEVQFEDESVHMISRQDLITSKGALRRLQDRIDYRNLLSRDTAQRKSPRGRRKRS